MTPRSDVTINVTAVDGRLRLDLSSSQGHSLSLSLGLTTLQLGQIRAGLAEGLRRFVAIVAGTGNITKDPKLATEAIRQLYGAGTELSFSLFKTNGPDVQEFFNRACPGWRLAGEEQYVPPWVEIVGPLDFPLPLDFVPVFDTAEPDWRNEASFVENAARFLPFSTILTRTVSDRSFTLIENDVLENSPALMVRLFRDANLEGAAKEAAYLRAAAPRTQLRGPWPDQSFQPADFVARLAKQLYDARSPDDAFEQEQPDHIQHFVCHCDTEHTMARDYTMMLAHDRPGKYQFWKSTQQRATIAQLQSAFGRYPRRKLDARPLVFLNACGSSKVTSEGVTSFPGLFFDIKNRGVIGTETAVPDLEAAEFGRIFYKAFEDFSLGEAIYRARMSLLQRYNPVGILYTIYANPGLRLRNPAGATRPMR